MKALVVEKGAARVREVPRPRPHRGHALVRVLVSGICNTDLELAKGYHGFEGVLGHEFVGRVEGPKTSPLLGKRVVGEINLNCGHCPWCADGLPRHCPRRKVLGIVGHPGAHAGWLTLPEQNLHVVPDHLLDEEAVFTEPLAAACEILEQVKITPGARVAVLGAGKLGTLMAQVLAHEGANVTLVGRDEAPRRADFEVVVEATGSPSGMSRALALVRPRGTIVWKSTHSAPVRFDAAPLVVNEITVVGSRCGPFAPALELLASRTVNVGSLLSADLPLSEGARALKLAARKGVRKVLLRP